MTSIDKLSPLTNTAGIQSAQEHSHRLHLTDRVDLEQIPASSSEAEIEAALLANPPLSADDRQAVMTEATRLVSEARKNISAFSAEKLMATYRLSDQEGRLIMELAEALLRTPDSATRDFLIHDKLSSGHWLAADAGGFVKGAGYALSAASGVARSSRKKGLVSAVSRFGLSSMRVMIAQAMRQLGGQFVYAETIKKAVDQAKQSGALMSFDMLGEAARSEDDCQRYFKAYQQAIIAVGTAAKTLSSDIDVNMKSGVSVKLSALSCQFKSQYWKHAQDDLLTRVLELAHLAKSYDIPLTIDAEEAGRLAPTLSVFRYLRSHPSLAGWSGLGLVVQAYARHAGSVIDTLLALARAQQTRFHLRLVKGAYWDSEIKLAQEKGLKDFPVFTKKVNTDRAYLAHARKLLEATDWVHPQFATHNAYTLAAVAHMAKQINPQSFEFQKLHGMGDAVHQDMQSRHQNLHRVYAPVGIHQDLLAYLVRRLLENGANSSFINQLADSKIAIDRIISDPFEKREGQTAPALRTGSRLFGTERSNSHGFDAENPATLMRYQNIVQKDHQIFATPEASQSDIANAFDKALQSSWGETQAVHRADCLDRIACLYEEHDAEIFRLLAQEAGKTIDDAAGEWREAIDFCRNYAAQLRKQPSQIKARGIVVAISPWNFPLAIFTGQIVAALAAGNKVIAKPAEQTPQIAAFAASLMHQAGIAKDALIMLYGSGEAVGAGLVEAGQADMVVFTGSTATAKIIEASIAASAKPFAPLLAETGGLNAMIVDSSALLERVVDDVLASSFQSAGQRCSALRVLYVQESIAGKLQDMLVSAASCLNIGDPRDAATDIGPVIDKEAKAKITDHVAAAAKDGRLIWQGNAPSGDAPSEGLFCPPAIVSLSSIADLEEEIFGPVLHMITYPEGQEDEVVKAINASGYGLTFGMQSRIDENIKKVTQAINVGNIYVNRNQIGAVVGSQPFGGCGLSGTGPKAGGGCYLNAFQLGNAEAMDQNKLGVSVLPGPDGELNEYHVIPRGTILVIHPDASIRAALSEWAKAKGNTVIERHELSDDLKAVMAEVDAVLTENDGQIDGQSLRQMIHASTARVLPVINGKDDGVWLVSERHLCRDMTASGGNVDLLSKS
jgi:RHH-type proline utilization regulon transcriptional repressor/proline dehydrogenase/delta 1-pyrroline-5-carboxylate dehydrogenase